MVLFVCSECVCFEDGKWEEVDEGAREWRRGGITSSHRIEERVVVDNHVFLLVFLLPVILQIVRLVRYGTISEAHNEAFLKVTYDEVTGEGKGDREDKY